MVDLQEDTNFRQTPSPIYNWLGHVENRANITPLFSIVSTVIVLLY